MSDITIRSVTENDASLLHSLATSCPPLDVHTPYTYWVLTHMFRDGCFVAMDGDKPVGFVTTVRKGDRAFLWQIGVLATHRSRKISTTLIESVVAWARDNGLTRVEMSIDKNNAASLGTFRAFAAANGLGFSAVGDVHLTIESDPSFSEDEDIYSLQLTAE